MKEKRTNKVVKNDDKKKQKTKMIMGIAMMIFAVAIAGGTYAFYQTTISGTVSGTILAWDCNNGSDGSGTINLGDLKPGSSGQFTLKAYSTNFKVDLVFKLNTGTNVPSNLKFYKAKSGTNYSSAITLGTNAWTDNGVAKGSTGKSHVVYWNWPIGTSAETPMASGTSNLTVTIPYTITCTQSATQ